MQTTGRSLDDRVLAGLVALAANGLIAWQLQALLAPQSGELAADTAPALQVVWIAAAPRHAAAVAAPIRRQAAKSNPSTGTAGPREVRTKPSTALGESPADLPRARPMAAVYLQQARQWAREHPAAMAPVDPFANRRVPLADQAASRFRLKRPASVAGTLAMVGLAFGGPGYTTDDCGLIRGRVVGLVVGGDEQAAQQDLEYERRHCRP